MAGTRLTLDLRGLGLDAEGWRAVAGRAGQRAQALREAPDTLLTRVLRRSEPVAAGMASLARALRLASSTLVVLADPPVARAVGALLAVAVEAQDASSVHVSSSADPVAFATLLSTLELSRTAWLVAAPAAPSAGLAARVAIVKALLQGQLGADAVASRLLVAAPRGHALERVAREQGSLLVELPPSFPLAALTLSSMAFLAGAFAGVDVQALARSAVATTDAAVLPDEPPPFAWLSAVLEEAAARADGRPLVLVPGLEALAPACRAFARAWNEATGARALVGALEDAPSAGAPALACLVSVRSPRDDAAVPDVFPREPDLSRGAHAMLSSLRRAEELALLDALARADVPFLRCDLPVGDLRDAGEWLATTALVAGLAAPVAAASPRVRAMEVGSGEAASPP